MTTMTTHDSSSSVLEEIDIKSLDRQFKGLPKQLEKAACNIDQVLKLAAEQRAVSIKDAIPLSESKEGIAAVSTLTSIRTKFTTRLIVFRDMLLPVSSRVVNALHNLLDFMDDEELFLELAKAGEVSELCNFHAKDEADVQKGYEYLSADLHGLSSVLDNELKKVEMDVEALLLKEKKHKESQVKLQWIAGGIATVSLITGATLMTLALGPVGIICVGSAQLAPAIFSACVAGSGAGALATKCAATAQGANAIAAHNHATTVNNAHGGAAQQLPQAIVLFSEAMGCLAEFFATFGQSIRDIERTAERIECRLKREAELDKCYKALYATLRKKLAEVRISCGEYQCFVSRVNIGVKHLQLGETRPSLSYIDEWMQEQVAPGEAGARYDISHLQRLQEMAVKQTTGAQMKLESTGRSLDVCSKRMIRV